MSKDNGGPAYPCTEIATNALGTVNVEIHHIGMTLRQRYAMAAMQGMLTGTLGRFSEKPGEVTTPYCYGPCNAAVAARAFAVADAMITHEQQEASDE